MIEFATSIHLDRDEMLLCTKGEDHLFFLHDEPDINYALLFKKGDVVAARDDEGLTINYLDKRLVTKFRVVPKDDTIPWKRPDELPLTAWGDNDLIFIPKGYLDELRANAQH